MTIGEQVETTSSLRVGHWLPLALPRRWSWPRWVAIRQWAGQWAQYVCWDSFSDLVRVLWPCRVSIAVLLAASFPLVTEQGRELMIGLAETSDPTKFWILAAQMLWIFLSWFSARLLLNTAFSLDREHERDGRAFANKRRMKGLINQVPHINGSFGCGGIIAIYWLRAGNGINEIIYSLVIAAALYVFFLIRGNACNRNEGPAILVRLCKIRPCQAPQDLSNDRDKGYRSLRDLPPAVWYMAVISSGLFLVPASFATAASVLTIPLAMHIGTLIVAFSAFALLVAAAACSPSCPIGSDFRST